jgi:hypothetical protein
MGDPAEEMWDLQGQRGDFEKKQVSFAVRYTARRCMTW